MIFKVNVFRKVYKKLPHFKVASLIVALNLEEKKRVTETILNKPIEETYFLVKDFLPIDAQENCFQRSI